MRLLTFSDLHRDVAIAEAVVSASTDVDVVVGAGDFATRGTGLQDTLDILRRLAVPFVLVPGNHDDLAELRQACTDWPLAHVLHGESVILQGVSFFGIGFGSGVVNPEPWNKVLDEDDAARLLKDVPIDAVVISHSPPYGVADQQKDGRHDGSPALREAIRMHQPRLTICGHIHNGWGQSGRIGQTPVHNIGPKARLFAI
jgi:uncharacterized protein